MSDYYYDMSRAAHILGLVLLLGNGIISPHWRKHALVTGDFNLIKFANDQTIYTDFVFTAVGITIMFATGLANLEIAGTRFHDNLWALIPASILFFNMLIWFSVLVPMQTKMSNMLVDEHDFESQKSNFLKTDSRWRVVKWSTNFLWLTAVLVMVIKPIEFLKKIF